ncbi:c-myc promoter binding protein [Anaeramoeba flamelloides]|uniref:C-myc promoter binding protein n=1 Tax=Anaeramoeba flamelloides TaxID=1746091 RepID=A0AAV8AEE0_9EUKA|nr:c-myc promoter binding protein [Anaeramoeba flamelloides]
MTAALPKGSSVYEFLLILGKNTLLKIQPPSESEDPYTEPLTSHTLEAQILDVYPEEKRKSLPPKIEEFALPYGGIGIRDKIPTKTPTPYEFVLTDMEGAHFYGLSVSIYYSLDFETYAQICSSYGDLSESSFSRKRNSSRLIPRDLFVESVVVLVTQWPFHQSFSNLLKAFVNYKQIVKPFDRSHLLELDIFLSQIKSFEKNHLGINLSVKNSKTGNGNDKECGNEKEIGYEKKPALIHFPVIQQNHENLPLIDIDFTVLFSSLDPQNVIKCFTSILCEKKLIFVSSNYRSIFPLIEALKTLIYPFAWAFAYIPLLPFAYAEFLQAPTPYLIGCHRSTLLKIEIPQDVVIIDIDDNEIYSEEKLIAFPKKLRNRLLRNIKKYYNTYKPNNNTNEKEKKKNFSIVKAIETIEKESEYIAISFSSSSESSGDEKKFLDNLEKTTSQRVDNNLIKNPNSKNNKRQSRILKFKNLVKLQSKIKDYGITSISEQETENTHTNKDKNSSSSSSSNSSKNDENYKNNNNNENSQLFHQKENKIKIGNSITHKKGNESENQNEKERGETKETVKGNLLEKKNTYELRRKFVTVFFSLFKKYRRYIIYPTKENPDPETIFQIEEFLKNVSEEFHHFLRAFLNSQMFISFIESKLLNCTNEKEFDYFDQNVLEKIQRRSLKYNIISSTKKTSFLFKRGQRFKKWKTRWFVLNQKILKYYYKNENKNNKKAKLKYKGEINLKSGETIIRIPRTQSFHLTNFPFEITTPKKTYLICAKDNLLRMSWISALRAKCLSKKEVEFYKRLSPILPYKIKTSIINNQRENAKKRRSPFNTLFGWDAMNNQK